MMKAKLFAVISSFLMLTGCGSYSESTPAVTVQSESSSDMMQSESSGTVTFETNGTYVTVPGSQNPDHILENYSIFDFELTDAEMQRMAELHTGQRYENW